MESITGLKKPSRLSSMLGPGFRFHPTDEELVQYYLRRKVSGKPFRFDAISDVDVYKAEPWDLPHMSKLKTRDLEWYFFSFLDKKYGNGARTNRATEKGYWKTTGKDRAVYHKKQIVGMKKTLVYHSGRAPKGQRTNWVMHEYRLSGLELDTAVAQDAFVICRIFQKSGSGPKNGEQYGAPLLEDEWDEEFESVYEHESSGEVNFGDDACLNSLDIQEIFGSDVPLGTAPLPVNFHCTDGDQYSEPKMCDDKNIHDMPPSFDMDAIPVKQKNIGECSKSGNPDDFNFLLDEPYLDSFDNLPNGEEGFLEANDLSNPTETDTTAIGMLEEYLTYFDANEDSSMYFPCDPDMMFGSEDLFSGQTLFPQKETGEATEQAVLPSGQLIDNNNIDALSSSVEPDSAKYQSGFQYPFIKKASQMLGNIPAPPAFAAEFPSKDADHRLNFVSQSPGSMHVPTSMMHVRNLTGGTNQPYGKQENFNVVLSFGFSRGEDGSSSLESSVSIVPGKTAFTMSRGWLYFIVFLVLILYMSFQIGSFICVN